MSALATVDLAVGYDRVVVVPELSVAVPPGKVTAIVGANGCGKSTILKACARILRPLAGAVRLDGDDVHAVPTPTRTAAGSARATPTTRR
jgi:iron complex transport system ATP-binding protein